MKFSLIFVAAQRAYYVRFSMNPSANDVAFASCFHSNTNEPLLYVYCSESILQSTIKLLIRLVMSPLLG